MKNGSDDSGANSPGADAAAVGRTIRALRRRAHLSQGGLAARLGMRQGPVSNLENGKHFPSAQVLLKLTAVLGVTADEILRPESYVRPAGAASARLSESEEAVPYRVAGEPYFCGLAPGLRQTAARPALAAGGALADRIETLVRDTLALEDICRVPRQARIPLQIPFGLSPSSLARLASQVRALLGVRSAVVFDYLELFENHGLRVVFADLLGEAHSLSFHDARHSNVFLFVDDALNPEKQIFSLAYELGRVFLLTRALLAGGPPPMDEEANDKAARLFAATFLMPEEVVCDSVRQIGVQPGEWDLPLMLRLKHRFGVSAESFNYRLLELELITPGVQADLRARIQDHYAAHAFAEPGQSRRILSPNGRLGDLLHTALRRADPEAREIAARLKRMKVRIS